jgi:hypothetical protein
MTLCCAEQRGECRAKDAVYQPSQWGTEAHARSISGLARIAQG